jgi:hypothetical protein
MGLASFAQWLVLAVAATEAAIEPAPSAADLPEPIFTRQTLFSIPFQIDTAGDPARQAAEVQLHVSTDRGRTWQNFMSVEPARSQFLFRAAGDGQYWFQVRTLDHSGKIRPEPTDRPGLCVVVDTTPPQLDLEAWQGEAGQITAKWQVTEPHLHPDGLTIQYRLDSEEQWQAVAMDRQTAPDPGPARSGQVTWVPNKTGRILEIRAEAADSAGNRVVNHAQVALVREKVATNTPDQAPAVKDDFAGWSPIEAPSVTDSTTTGPPVVDSGVAGPTAVESAGETGGRPENESWDNSIAAQSHPSIHDQFVPESQPAPSDGVAPSQPQPQMINTCVFELGYEVDLAGAGSVESVELWATRDGGQTWSNFGRDPDNRSPVMARVDGEGIWGFLITVRDARGLGGEPPQPGDTPDVFVGVDLTDPVARILSIEPSDRGPILIRWEAADAALLKRPISLHGRAEPGGPWTLIADDLENSGRYEWWRDPQTPRPIAFRLEVRDAAGNVGVFETPEAPASNAHEPIARIHGVRPANQPTPYPSSPGSFR